MLRRCAPRFIALQRALRLDKLQVSPSDTVLAVQDGVGIYSFASYVGASADEVAGKILSIPDSNRCIHALFGRESVPMDFAADVEFPLYENVTQPTDPYTGEGIMIDVVTLALEKLRKRGIKAETVLLLDGQAKNKHSYHLHVRGTHALDSFESARTIAADVDALLRRPFPVIDLAPYRRGGMMRTAFSVKFTERERAMVPIDPKDPELRRLVLSGSELSKQQQLALSLIQRHPEVETVTAKSSKTGSKHGVASSKALVNATDEDKEKYFRRAVGVMSALPDFCTESYDVWVRVGLSLHSFNLGGVALEQWMQFSSRCRHKYDDDACRKQWEKWDRSRREDEKDWKRAFGYLALKLPRQIRELSA